MEITLANLKDKTPQQIFNHVVAHARLQRQRCVNERNHCLYRYSGLKCFAGALMSDQEAEQIANGAGWYDVVLDMHMGTSAKINDLVSSLQNIHDHFNISDWDEQFKELAKDWDLVYIPKPIEAAA